MRQPPCANKTCNPAARAFSLIETVIALGVTSFGLIALLGMVPVGINTARDSLERSTATTIAQNIISDLSQTSWSALTNERFYFNDEGRQVSVNDPSVTYTAATRMDQADIGTPFPFTENLVKLRVEIRSTRGSAYPQTFSALIANRGQ